MTLTKNAVARTLIVDDDPFVRESLREILEHDGFEALEAGDGKTALDLLDQEAIDLLLLDLEIPRISGINVLRTLVERRLDIPVVIISGKGGIPEAVLTMKLGAFDFIEKPLDAQRTLATIHKALDQLAQRRRQRTHLDTALERYGMVGTSDAMQPVYTAIDRAAATRAKVLVIGESGTGKEMVASAIHHRSTRNHHPLIAVNCAAIPENLIESELFGHVEGAFTGARKSHRGKFELADQGTLFLDEIADMSLMTQAKVLRVLETGEIQRVGGEQTKRLDFRLIAATNRELAGEIDNGNFREDLFYRLSVITIHLPSLRRRRDDIPQLIAHFTDHHSRSNNLPVKDFTTAAMALLVEYDWPGNLRELSNVVERIVVLEEAPTIAAGTVRKAIGGAGSDDHQKPDTTNLRDARLQFETEYITAALVARSWRIQETADALGINRSHLWKKMRQLGIETPELAQ